MSTKSALTKTQARYLDEIREAPGRHYDGRARKPLEALRALGLIEYEHVPLPAIGTERFICRPASTDEETGR